MPRKDPKEKMEYDTWYRNACRNKIQGRERERYRRDGEERKAYRRKRYAQTRFRNQAWLVLKKTLKQAPSIALDILYEETLDVLVKIQEAESLCRDCSRTVRLQTARDKTKKQEAYYGHQHC